MTKQFPPEDGSLRRITVDSKIFGRGGKPRALVDCYCILDDDRIRRYFELGCEVKGMGGARAADAAECLRTEPTAN